MTLDCDTLFIINIDKLANSCDEIMSDIEMAPVTLY